MKGIEGCTNDFVKITIVLQGNLMKVHLFGDVQI